MKDMKQGAIIQSRDLAGASVIQQLGLDTPQGMQKIMGILLHKLDPESKGVVVTLQDIQNYAVVAVERPNVLVNGDHDSILFKLCTDAEMQRAAEHAEEVFKSRGIQ